MYPSKRKRTFPDVVPIGELFSKFGNFKSDCLVNLITKKFLVLEEERLCRSKVIVFLRGDCHACDVY